MNKDKNYYEKLLDETFDYAIMDTIERVQFIPPTFIWNEDTQLYIADRKYKYIDEECNLVVYVRDITLPSGITFSEATIMLGTFLENGHFYSYDYFDQVYRVDDQWHSIDDVNSDIKQYYLNMKDKDKDFVINQFKEFNIDGIV